MKTMDGLGETYSKSGETGGGGGGSVADDEFIAAITGEM